MLLRDVIPLHISSGHGKPTAWKAFVQHSDLLTALGQDPLTEEATNAAETFLCRVYQVDMDTCNEARVLLFTKGR